MIFELKTVRRTINKAFLKEPIERGSFTVFKDALEKFHNDVEIAKGKNEYTQYGENIKLCEMLGRLPATIKNRCAKRDEGKTCSLRTTTFHSGLKKVHDKRNYKGM